MKKICFVTACDSTIEAFMIKHLKELSKIYQITVVTNTRSKTFLKKYGLSEIEVIDLKILRKISLMDDINALIKLIKLFRKKNFDSVHSITPKAGLLTSLAGKISKTDKRIHIFTGQVWMNYRGSKRLFFKMIDKLIVLLNTDILIDSKSQRGFLRKEKILKKNQGEVLGSGSISGVDLNKFKKDKNLRIKVREDLSIGSKEIVFGFIGRLSKDKGISELVKAFKCEDLEECKLLIIGPDEENLKKCLEEKNIIYLGFQSEPEKFLNIMDVFCLPSHREGFGSVLIEAAAMGVPSVASNIYGINDAVKDKKTGLLHEVRNIEDLRLKMLNFKNDSLLRKKLGEAAAKRAIEEFSANKITEEWVKFYKNKV